MKALLAARLASIPLIAQTPAEMPEDAGCCCLIDFPKKRLLLTVRHVTHGGGDWRILIKQKPGNNIVTSYRVGGLRYLVAGRIKKPTKRLPVEYAYVDVPQAVFPMDQIGDTAEPEFPGEPKTILPPRFVDPTPSGNYAFYGLTRWDIDDQFRVHIEQKYEDGLTFKSTDRFYHTFSCSKKYFDYSEYKGCSGAPIMDQDGNLASLLIEGTENKRGFVGLNLRMVWSALQIEAGLE